MFSGIGDAAVNRFLAALNLPSIDSKTLKKRERKVGTAVEDAAHSSYHDAIEHEKSCSEEGMKTVSFDAGWQTRGSGRNYASLSGHGSMIGASTGQVFSYAVRCKKM